MLASRIRLLFGGADCTGAGKLQAASSAHGEQRRLEARHSPILVALRIPSESSVPMILQIAFSITVAAQPVPPQIGAYVPNSQLLKWCKSPEATDFGKCWSFIAAVVESSGITATKWPQGPVRLPFDVMAHDLVPVVVQHIEGLGAEQMSSPAVRAVYDAAVARYPYRK